MFSPGKEGAGGKFSGLQRCAVAAAVRDTAACSAERCWKHQCWVSTSDTQPTFEKCWATLLRATQEKLCMPAEQRKAVLILSEPLHGTNCLPSILSWAVPFLAHVLSKDCWQRLWNRAATSSNSHPLMKRAIAGPASGCRSQSGGALSLLKEHASQAPAGNTAPSASE